MRKNLTVPGTVPHPQPGHSTGETDVLLPAPPRVESPLFDGDTAADLLL